MTSALYKRTESIPVKSGDVIYVGCGDRSWPSMNKQGDEARDYVGTKYTITVYDQSNKVTYDAPSAEDKEKVDNYSVLKAALERITFLEEIQHVKDLLDAIPEVGKLTEKDVDKVKAASKAFEALTEKQKEYITIADAEK